MFIQKFIWSSHASKFYSGSGLHEGVDWQELKSSLKRLIAKGEVMLAGA